MAKDKSFAAKVSKATSEKNTGVCPTCSEQYTPVKLVVSEKSEARDAWRFNQRLVLACKCNHAEVYG